MELYLGDCLEEMKKIPDGSVDLVLTDPPYELGFMGKSWDSTGIANNVDVWKECLRVLKPGGYLLSFGGTRTYHRMASAIEDAGFEVRDMIEWVYSTGFPKSLNVFKQLKKQCICGNMEAYEQGTKTLSKHDMRPMQESDISQEVADTKTEGEVLQSGLSEQGTHDEGQEAVAMLQFSEGGEKSSVERGTDLQKTQGQLQGGDISEMPTGVSTDGEERRIHNATQTGDGSTSQPTTDESGSGTSHRPQSKEQSDREPCAFCKQWGTQATRTLGIGTALKPAHEPICMARKPLAEKTVAENVLKYGTGGINIDESRVTTEYYLQGSDLFDILNVCQLNNLNSSANSAELKNFQDDTTNAIKKLCSALVSADTLILEKTLGTLQENTTIMDMLCCEEMSVESMNASLNIFTSGKKPTDLYLKIAKYTILTAKKMITDYQISNALVSQLTENLLTLVKKQENIQGVSGRFPSNFIHDNSEEVRECFPETNPSKKAARGGTNPNPMDWGNGRTDGGIEKGHDDNGGNASRFFKSIIYQAKASKSDRGDGNNHPTVKPVALMEYLITMTSRDGATILDPFMGSGTTGVACKRLNRNFIGIEMDETYFNIAKERIDNA